MATTLTGRSAIPRDPSKTVWRYYAVLGLLIVALWVPRVDGPIDMRWDGGVYYVLGTSLAEGKGYRLLNEPGEIEAIQYPPLLPLIVAAHQRVLGTSDPLVVGRWLRVFSFVIFFAYVGSIFLVLKRYLPLKVGFIGTLICLFHTNTYFMSDLLFPEVLFGLATTLFVLLSLNAQKRGLAVAAALLGIAAFGLRTIGITLLMAWVAESLFNKNVKLAGIRLAVALIPLFCWQAYIASVVSGPTYIQPAYDYQRAEYMFYNVSYAKNIFTFKDPFIPELGRVSVHDIATRFLFNLGHIPQSLGEAVSSKRIAYLIPWKFFDLPFPISTPWPVDLGLFALGSLVLTGMVVQLTRRQWLLPLYVLFSIAVLCLTPWPQQFPRYLMPLTPFLVLSLLTALLAAPEMSIKWGNWKRVAPKFLGLVVSLILLQHALTVSGVYTRRHQNVMYQDRMGEPIQYKLFYYRDAHRALDAGLDWLREHAKPQEVLAGSMPHWMFLRTGLKTVMPPFEADPVKAQGMLDSVPVTYLLQDEGLAVDTKRYIEAVIKRFPEQWERVYIDKIAPDDQQDPVGTFAIYRRVELLPSLHGPMSAGLNQRGSR
jgi:hypothetical protein